MRLKLFRVAFVLIVIFFKKKDFAKIMIEIKKSLFFSQNSENFVTERLWHLTKVSHPHFW